MKMMPPRPTFNTSASSATLSSSISTQSLNPITPSTAPTIVSAASSTGGTSAAVEFPFTFLHIEMVRQFRERDADLAKGRVEWLEALKRTDNNATVWERGEDGSKGEEGQRRAMIDGVSRRIFAYDNCETRLESIGHRVGIVLVERVARNLPLRLSTELEIMKFVCKEFWNAAFGKGVDNLKTNHQGVYTLQDNRFSTLLPFSDGGQQYLKEAVVFLALPAGIVRGALGGMGLEGVVTASVEKLPVVVFKVEILQRAQSS